MICPCNDRSLDELDVSVSSEQDGHRAACNVLAKLLSLQDGPMLEALKRLDRGAIHRPRRSKDLPDRERLALRFELFKAAA